MKTLNHISTSAPKNIIKADAEKELEKMREKLYALQNLFNAERKHGLLIVLQGMDASGKDGTIRHVFSCVNPQGCNVQSFKSPSEEEKLHDFLWRIYPHFPAKGMIQIFNRSHYEDVLFPVAHKLIDKKEVQKRFTIINELEEHLQNNNTTVLKFFLHISKSEQQDRLKKRLVKPEKRWKANPNDQKEARLWDNYHHAYQDVIENCKKHNEWIVVPADQKWYRNYFVAKTIVETLESLKMKFPK